MTHSMRATALLGGTALALTAACVVGAVTPANAAEPTAAPSAASTAVRADVRAIMHALPDSLRKDLRAAEHHVTRDERHDALVAVEKRVLAGDYGTTAKTVAADVQAEWSSVPEQAAHRAERLVDGRRHDVVRTVRGMLRRALAGKDGTSLQHQLESLASTLPAVPAPRGQSGSTTGS